MKITASGNAEMDREFPYDKTGKALEVKDTVYCRYKQNIRVNFKCWRGTWDYRSGKLKFTGMLRAGSLHKLWRDSAEPPSGGQS